MWELYHGGWLAENIYYLGAAGCVRVGGLRIVGASGIYKDHDYTKGTLAMGSEADQHRPLRDCAVQPLDHAQHIPYTQLRRGQADAGGQ
jgi:hypothetical protein